LPIAFGYTSKTLERLLKGKESKVNVQEKKKNDSANYLLSF
jgi:hypothetical protein